MTIARRLSALEALYQPADSRVLTDEDRRWYLGLCASPWLQTAEQFAATLAERRLLADGGFPDGARSGWSGDWNTAIPEDQRTALIQSERDRLASLALTYGGDDAALDQWLGTADREGWPRLGGIVSSMDLEGFEAIVTRRRAGLDTSRASGMFSSPQWCRNHPGWRVGMTGGAAKALEVELIKEAERLSAEWYGANAGEGT